MRGWHRGSGGGLAPRPMHSKQQARQRRAGCHGLTAIQLQLDDIPCCQLEVCNKRGPVLLKVDLRVRGRRRAGGRPLRRRTAAETARTAPEPAYCSLQSEK